MQLRVQRRLDDDQRSAISALLDAAARADGHHTLSDHAWLDLVDGGRPGFSALTAWQDDHTHPVGYAQVSKSENGANFSVDLVVDPHHRFDGAEIGEALLRAAFDSVAGDGGGHVHLWVSHPTAAHDRLAERIGLKRGRDLLQLRVPLPLSAPIRDGVTVATRPFVVGQDERRWVDVNNRAFQWHPEQGGWTVETLERREKESWFDPLGFLLHERDAPDGSGPALAAFCWTKLHLDTSLGQPQMGEIYVIAVNPDYQGLGLGRALTIAGLQSIHERGLEVGMLYVDAANEAAVTLYFSLGFTLDHVDRAYVADIAAA